MTDRHLNYKQLLNPELLSDKLLLEILKTRCLDPRFSNTLKRPDLIALFEKMVLPLPQRRYNESRLLGKRLANLRVVRKISLAVDEDQNMCKTYTSSQTKVLEDTKKCDNFSSKQSHTESQSLPKNNHPVKPYETNKNSENGYKRKTNEVPTHPEFKKQRQKITWP